MPEHHKPAPSPGQIPWQVPWQVPVAVEDVAEQGEHFDLVADAATRAAVARVAGLRELPRLEAVLRAILRAGAYELLHRQDVPPRVAVSEYTDIAHAFFSGKEPGLANGVLDRLARSLRPGDFRA